MVDRTKVLYLVGQFPAINHGYLLAEVKHLRRLGIEVSVASVSPSDRPLDELSPEEREEAARTYYIKSVTAARVALLSVGEFFRHPVRCLRGLACALRLAGGSLRRLVYHLAYFAEAVLVGRRMRAVGASHIYSNFSATVALIAAHTFPVTMSFAVHGFGELHDPAGTNLSGRIHGALFVRAVSRHGRAQLMLSCERSEWSKLVYVPLGIDPSQFVPRPVRTLSSPPCLLCVGRLAPEKGQALLLEAIAALQEGGCPVHLRLAGDGPDREWLKRRSVELGIASSVEFAGWIDQTRLAGLYAEADCFVLPSLAEGVPIVLMEAMAMQIPCVAPRIAGIPELIEHGVDGMLFTAGDAEDLKNTIRNLLESPEFCAQIGRQARARVVLDYDMARNTERFAAVLAQRVGR